MQNAKKEKEKKRTLGFVARRGKYRSHLLKHWKYSRGTTIEPRSPNKIILLTAGKRIPLIIIFTRGKVARRGGVN